MNVKKHQLASSEKALPIGRPSPGGVNHTIWRILSEINDDLWFAFDLLLCLLALGSAAMLFPVPTEAHLAPLWIAVISSALYVTFLQVFGLSEIKIFQARLTLLAKALYVALLTNFCLSAISLTIFFRKIDPSVLLAQTIILFGLIVLTRALLWNGLINNTQNVILLGGKKFCEEALMFLKKTSKPLSVSAFSLDRAGIREFDRQGAEKVEERASRSLIVVDPEHTGELQSWLSDCLDAGVPVQDYVSFVENSCGVVPVDQLDEVWFFSGKLGGTRLSFQILKRFCDIGIGFFGLLLSFPIMLIAGLAIFLIDRGPIFYKQTRVGKYCKNFEIYKLRTMCTSAEKNGAKWADKNDSRVTPIGRFLRLTRIDELPQFWNILKGDMSFVGPRPERPEFTKKLEERLSHYSRRHLVRPGLTGWAQINLPYGASEEDARQKLQFDLYYLKNASLVLDLRIIARTFGAVMHGAR